MAEKLSELRAACLVKLTHVRPWLQKFSFLLTEDTLESYELELESEDQTSDLRNCCRLAVGGRKRLAVRG